MAIGDRPGEIEVLVPETAAVGVLFEPQFGEHVRGLELGIEGREPDPDPGLVDQEETGDPLRTVVGARFLHRCVAAADADHLVVQESVDLLGGQKGQRIVGAFVVDFERGADPRAEIGLVDRAGAGRAGRAQDVDRTEDEQDPGSSQAVRAGYRAKRNRHGVGPHETGDGAEEAGPRTGGSARKGSEWTRCTATRKD